MTEFAPDTPMKGWEGSMKDYSVTVTMHLTVGIEAEDASEAESRVLGLLEDGEVLDNQALGAMIEQATVKVNTPNMGGWK